MPSDTSAETLEDRNQALCARTFVVVEYDLTLGNYIAPADDESGLHGKDPRLARLERKQFRPEFALNTR